MRIFVASGIFHPDSGGPATYLYRLLPELQARSHEVRVLAYGNAPTVGYPYPVVRIPFQTLPIRLMKYALAYRRGAAWADLIYLNSLGLPRSGDSRKPRVMKVVGDYAWERSVNRGWIAPGEDIDKFQHQPYSLPVNWAKGSRSREVQRMDRVIVPSDYLRRMVTGWGASHVQVIYNSLDINSYTPALTRAETRQQVGWQQDGKYLVTAARLTAWKGVDYLIDALAQVGEIRLTVAGDGPQFEALKTRAVKKQVTDRVEFLGKIPHERLAVYLRAADYLALYSGYEGLSHTILEALYAGTPVIASNRGGNPEIVRDGENGLLVPHPDLPALVSALHRAFEGDTPLRLATGAQKGLERFTWSCLVEQTVNALAETAGATR